MSYGDSASDVLVTLTAAGVSLVLHTADGRLPVVVHWGAALPTMDADQAMALADAAVPVIGSNNPDIAPHVSVLPEHHTGWTGRPGLTGSRAGRAWSPAFRVAAVLLDGSPADGVVHAGPRVRRVLRDRPRRAPAARPGRRAAPHRARARPGPR